MSGVNCIFGLEIKKAMSRKYTRSENYNWKRSLS